MKWGRLDSEFVGFAWKRLTPHEIDPKCSNGHEFQGINALSELLGKNGRQTIPTDYYLIEDDEEGNPSVSSVISSTSSWYDSRKEVSHRSAEWRLYYPADAGKLQILSKTGDLMVVGLRKDETLAVMLISGGSSTETAICNVLGINPAPTKGILCIEAKEEDYGLSTAETLEQLYSSFVATSSKAKPPLPLPVLDISGDSPAQHLAEIMLKRWPEKLGTSSDVVMEIINSSNLDLTEMTGNPDETLHRWLELAEASYRIWEKDVFTRFLRPLRGNQYVDDLELAELVSEKWMSFRQSRVSRAGKVLEIFLTKIFTSWNLRYDWGPVLTGNKRPDFLFPGKKEYEDKSFPRADLRLLGAKTSLKERWRQILAEGEEVLCKHGITRDDSITRSTFDDMKASSFTVVMPSPVIKKYATPLPVNLVTVRTFLESLRDLQSNK